MQLEGNVGRSARVETVETDLLFYYVAFVIIII